MGPRTWLWTPEVQILNSFLPFSLFFPQNLTQTPPSSAHVCACTALREDLYYDVGCLLALCLVHRGPPISFFSPALYQCLFNYPANQPLALGHMTPGTHLTRQVNEVGSTRMDG